MAVMLCRCSRCRGQMLAGDVRGGCESVVLCCVVLCGVVPDMGLIDGAGGTAEQWTVALRDA
jgi:hypothetical protein